MDGSDIHPNGSARRARMDEIRISRREPRSLSASEREDVAAFVLRALVYPRELFEATLDRADYLWLAHDHTRALVATTAVRAVEARCGDRAVTVLLTSMVVIDRSCRGLGLIPRFGVRSYLREVMRAPTTPLYWMALAATPAGFVTMASSFETYWPREGVPIPEAERGMLRDVLAQVGVTAIESDEHFRGSDDLPVADPTQASHRWDRSDPRVAYFLRANPDYARGGYLVCLCPLGIESLAKAVARKLWIKPRALRP